ncbi:ATP-binding protein [Geoalkalibacter halelectricus]|uniref:ATP-binding protein n=1 Tax=Geoalkalibacter halelectricus TaxID=2847045 RepID=UPI00266EBA47|nr:ATP-binding protein [Geoalkalibacter halelectricus]MDO3378503.1 ATP-binding protein [Geoalkalibacter halelectricus]
MRIGIKYRVFLAMLAATATVVLCMWLIVQWSINRGFLRYVNTLEQQRLENLATDLEQAYAEHGGWAFLGADPLIWVRLRVRTPPGEAVDPARLERFERWRARETQDSRNDQRHQPFERRVLLLDGDRRPLLAAPEPAAAVDLRPLRQAGHPIGYLGLVPRQTTFDTYQVQFVRQQELALALIAGATLLISALIALPLAQRLVRPLKTLAAATHRLSAGAYETRVPVAGDDELGQLARDFNTLALTLEKNEEARRQWVADISHELRTPLAVLRGEIEALQDGVRPDGPEALRSLHAEVLHLNRLVDDLYQLALSDLGALSYRKERLDLAAELKDAVELFRPAFAAKDLILAAHIPAAPANILADAERLRQLFNNLLDNSLKYTEPGGRLELRLETQGDAALIHIQDTAPGVPAADLERLFDRLYRVEASRRRSSGGAGLGLAICRNIVEAHEGSIHAAPAPLGGLAIHIRLPLAGGSA